MLPKIEWAPPSGASTHLRGMFNSPWTFEETVARLIGASDQWGDDAIPTDEYKVSVEFAGTFGGVPFTLYDYKEDNEIHIGGTDRLDVDGLHNVLLETLTAATPRSFTARTFYDDSRDYYWRGPNFLKGFPSNREPSKEPVDVVVDTLTDVRAQLQKLVVKVEDALRVYHQ